MGNRGDDLLKAFYRKDKIRARQASGPVMAPQTSEQQEALAATKTHSEKFIVTGGSHIHHVQTTCLKRRRLGFGIFRLMKKRRIRKVGLNSP
jgi:hypothetical protein